MNNPFTRKSRAAIAALEAEVEAMNRRFDRLRSILDINACDVEYRPSNPGYRPPRAVSHSIDRLEKDVRGIVKHHGKRLDILEEPAELIRAQVLKSICQGS